MADEIMQPIVDYLQFCLAFLTNERMKCVVDYKGRYLRKNVSPIVVLNNNGGQGYLLSISGDVHVRMDIGKTVFQYLQTKGITHIAPLFGTHNLQTITPTVLKDEYTDLICRAIRVFAEGERSNSPRQKILSYVTACELFFTRKSETTKAVTEGVAFIVASDYESRVEARKAMEKMYRARSSATHEGSEPEDLALYRKQVLEVLVCMGL